MCVRLHEYAIEFDAGYSSLAQKIVTIESMSWIIHEAMNFLSTTKQTKTSAQRTHNETIASVSDRRLRIVALDRQESTLSADRINLVWLTASCGFDQLERFEDVNQVACADEGRLSQHPNRATKPFFSLPHIAAEINETALELHFIDVKTISFDMNVFQFIRMPSPPPPPSPSIQFTIYRPMMCAHRAVACLFYWFGLSSYYGRRQSLLYIHKS